jgi:hypothetical protein
MLSHYRYWEGNEAILAVNFTLLATPHLLLVHLPAARFGVIEHGIRTGARNPRGGRLLDLVR